MDAARRALAVVRATVPERRRGNFDQEGEEDDVTDVWAQERVKDWRRGGGGGVSDGSGGDVSDGSGGDVESGVLGGGVGMGYGGRVENVRRVGESGYAEDAYAGDDEGRLGFIRRLTTGRRVAIITVSILAIFILINLFTQFRSPFIHIVRG
ncbi:hypothetical protein L873DRAFT_1762428 [Choiromyces venosus 120613-1]|uniref:Uncharacterized protein n=1 Tax=Choiromyces venosus 120613-1 TaxID=1336337 RepID=A0A3N4JV98_9PEZI|nr:hypothetical protein L873DRAFT_1762428 [Choiromyces venosus 120613-1]